MPSLCISPSLIAMAGLALGFAPALAASPAVKMVQARAVQAPTPDVPVRDATLASVHSTFSDGERIGTLHAGAGCAPDTERHWSQLLGRRIDAELPLVFQEELTRLTRSAGNPVAPLQVQAFLNDMEIAVCRAGGGAWSGGMYVQLGWQIVEPETGRVVYQASTEGSYFQPATQRTAGAAALREAMAVAVRNLLADPRFARLLQLHEAPRVAMAGPV